MLAKKTQYGLKSMLYLARKHGSGPISAAELASKEMIPRKFLEIILLELKNRGMLDSRKGKTGGFQLSRSPGEISAGEIIRALEGPIALVPCVSETAYRACVECEDERTCGIRMLCKEVHDATARLLDGATLADLIARVDSVRLEDDAALMYHI